MVCSSGVGFDPQIDGKRVFFGFHGIWQGTAVLYDRDTGSLWMHMTGECFDGPRKGRRLARVHAARHTRWREWRATHPTTDVMRPDPRFASQYFPREVSRAGDPFLSQEFERTIVRRDHRLRLADLVHGVVVGGAARAYPYDRLAAVPGSVVEETVGGVPVTVWFDPGARSATSYDRRLDGKTLSFERVASSERGEPARFRERTTGSVFDLDGEALAGPLRGRRLARLAGIQAEWYGWFAHHPDTTLLGS